MGEHSFRVPLDSKSIREILQLDGFRDPVFRIGNDPNAGTRFLYSLMMVTVYPECFGIHLTEDRFIFQDNLV